MVSTAVASPGIVIEQPAGTRVETQVVAWGDDTFDQTMVPLAAQSGVVGISAGLGHTIALKNDGGVVAWGMDSSGQTTVPAEAQSGVSAVAAGWEHSVVLKNDGRVVAWGDNDYYGQTTVPVNAQTGVVAIAAGAYHTVALKNDGRVIAWGNNTKHQTDVPGEAASNVVAISAGAGHTVALKSDGSVVVWGDNSEGQATVPTTARSEVVAISAGAYHTAVLKVDGSVVAWGRNVEGQTTTPPAAQSDVISISAGFDYTVVLKSDGGVVAWGNNDAGQATTPAFAQSGVASISAGFRHTVALKGVAFGLRALGAGSITKTFTLKNSGVTPFGITSVSLICGNFPDFVVNTTGMLASVPANGETTFTVTFVPGAVGTRITTLRIIGSDTAAHQFNIILAGAGGTASDIVIEQPAGTSLGEGVNFGAQPLAISPASKTFAIKNAGGSALGIFGVSVIGGDAADFTVNTTGMLGSVLGAEVSTTFTVTFVPGAVGTRTTTLRVLSDDADEGTIDIVLTGSGFTAPEILIQQSATAPVVNIIAWGGYNLYGEITIPAAAQSGVVAIAATETHTIALKNDGGVIAWGGYNLYGEITIPAAAQSGVVAIAATETHTIALKNDGGVIAWGGYNSYGETTIPAAAQSGVVAIAAAETHTIALKNDGRVIAWGDNLYGQTTVPLAAQAGVVAIATGKTHAVALKSDGRVIAWGDNVYGQTTIPVAAQSGVIAIAAYDTHTLALKSDGSVIAWGTDTYGHTTIPVAAQTGVVSIATSLRNSAAIKNDGRVVVWGADAYNLNTVPVEAQSGVMAIALGNTYAVALKAVSFGEQNVLTTGASKVFTIKNIGSAPLNLASVSVIGGNVFDFSVNTTGMLTNVPITSGETTFTVTFTPGAPGARSATVRVVSDDADEGTFDVGLIGTGVYSPLDTWKQTQFGPGASDPMIAGNTADLDGDAVPNILEYALRTNPNLPNPCPFAQPESVALPGGIPARRLSFPYRANATDICYIVERSSNLADWSELYRYDLTTGQITRNGVTSEENSAAEIITLVDPATGPALFWRLRVGQP